MSIDTWHALGGYERRRGRSTRPGEPVPPADRFTRSPGTYRPSLTFDSVGVPAGQVLTPWAGDLVYQGTADTVIEGLDVEGNIRVNTNAGTTTIRRCVIRVGALPALGTMKAAVQGSFSRTKPVIVEDCLIVPTNRSVDIYGLHARGLVARRNRVVGCVDGIVAYGTGCVIEANLLEDSPFYASDPRQTDGSHNDGIQVEGGGDGSVVGNEIRGFHNAAIQVTQNVGVITSLTIDRNWLDGGDPWSLNVADKAKGDIPLTLTSNRFGRASTEAQAGRAPAIMPPGTFALSTIAGNVWDDDGSPAPIRGNGA